MLIFLCAGGLIISSTNARQDNPDAVGGTLHRLDPHLFSSGDHHGVAARQQRTLIALHIELHLALCEQSRTLVRAGIFCVSGHLGLFWIRALAAGRRFRILERFDY